MLRSTGLKPLVDIFIYFIIDTILYIITMTKKK